MKIRASLNNYRCSAGKVREVTPVVVGLSVDEARQQLRSLNKGFAEDLLKLLESAIANAKNNFNLKETDLKVGNLLVNKARVLKRWRPRAHGRAMQILKRSHHIDLILETVELEKEASAKSAEKEIAVKEEEKPAEKETKEEVKKDSKEKNAEKKKDKAVDKPKQ